MSDAIVIERLKKSYPGFSLQPLDLTLPEGCVLGLVGENGAGKSTLIQLMMDAIPRDGGSVRLLGVDNQSPAFQRCKEEIGVVLDEAYFPAVLNARQVGRIMAATYRSWKPERYEQWLKRFQLPEDKAFKDFSRGMRMKLAIAVALSHQAKLLLLDEATGGLDPLAREEILDILNDFAREEGHSILLSSHIVSDLEKICDYIAVLHQGKLLLCQEKDRLLEEYALVQLSAEEARALPEGAVLGRKESPYGVRLLVRRSEVSPAFPLERTTLEEIILFMTKGEEKA